MGRIEADIALESWLFGFRPCSGQGQLTLPEMCPMARLQSMAFSTRSCWCGAVLAGADYGYTGAVQCEFGVVRCGLMRSGADFTQCSAEM